MSPKINRLDQSQSFKSIYNCRIMEKRKPEVEERPPKRSKKSTSLLLQLLRQAADCPFPSGAEYHVRDLFQVY